ncbi:MAG TPA: peptidyl-prolyl cis-trans isomerase [Tepidisphaeraceae bacterium]|jgi:hypothetical protein|nr:peptidyl-prolyl cis-trans isomerase [Tepidisphaeraceae bacterium]
MSKRVVGVANVTLAAAAMAAVGGCGLQPAPILSPDAFVLNRPVVGEGVGQPIDRPGALIYDAEHRPGHVAAGGEQVSKTVHDSVQSPAVETARAENGSDFPAPDPFGPETQPADVNAPGQFQWVGSVLAVVNGQAVYANKVLSTLDRALAAEARKGNEQRFKVVAADLVSKQINEFISNELEFAAAQRSLEPKDEQVARAITNEERKDLIRKAGGSEAMARQRAAEDGQDFEEVMQQKFRLNMTRLYYQKKVFPLIQVGAQDIRRYYQDNLREFQKPAGAQFHVIKISPQARGSRDAALEKARELSNRAKQGEDFAELAGKNNDDPTLMKRSGLVGDGKGWMEKGAYAVEKVDEAVWDMRPGDISPPIDARDPIDRRDYFYLVKVDAMRPGVTEPFESQKVQDAIRETLKREQFNKLRDKHRRELMQKAVIRENPDMLQIALEMVMQKYPQWVASR